MAESLGTASVRVCRNADGFHLTTSSEEFADGAFFSVEAEVSAEDSSAWLVTTTVSWPGLFTGELHIQVGSIKLCSVHCQSFDCLLVCCVLNESDLSILKVLALGKFSVRLKQSTESIFVYVHGDVLHEELPLAGVIRVHCGAVTLNLLNL